MPLVWIGDAMSGNCRERKPLPLVLFDHPCLFRQTALRRLDQIGRRWRLALTTPSLPGLWAALQAGHGITARTRHRIPAGLRELDSDGTDLPDLPPIDLRLLTGTDPTQAAADLGDVLRKTALRHVAQME